MKTLFQVLLFVLLLPITLLGQRPPLSATLTNPTSKTFILDRNSRLPNRPVHCFLVNGKLRKYPCEFTVEKLAVINSPEPPLTYPGWGKKSMTLFLSKANTQEDVVKLGRPLRYYTFSLSLTIRRLAAPAKPVPTYVLTLMQRAKGRESILLSDIAVPSGPVKPGSWPASAQPALTMPVGSTQIVTVSLKLLTDPVAKGGPLIITKDFDMIESAPTEDLRMYLHNMATTFALGSAYSDARDFAEWAASVELSLKP